MAAALLNEEDIQLQPVTKCPLCGSTKRKFVGNRGPSTHSIAQPFPGTKELYAKLEELKVYDCENCGLLYCDPVPVYDQRVSSIIYNEEYCTRHRSPEESHRKARHARYEIMLKNMLGRLGVTPSAAVRHLDVGSGLGDVVVGATRLGLTSEGLDLSETVCNFAKQVNGVNIYPYSLFDERIKPATYDVITMFDIIEHVPNPRDFIARAVELLKPGGGLIIDTPNEKGFVMRIGNFMKGPSQTINLSPCADPYHLVGYGNKAINYITKEFKLKPVFKSTMAVTLQKTGDFKTDLKVSLINAIDELGKRFDEGSEFFLLLKKE